MNNREQATQLVSTRDWESLERMLRSLSNMEFRRMERVMREEVLTQLENGLFWETLLHLIIYKKAAFLTGATAVEHLAMDGTLDFSTRHVAQLCQYLKETQDEARIKLCHIMAPLLLTERQWEDMFSAMQVESSLQRLAVLLKIDSPLAYYLIFKTLKMADDKTTARKCCMAIIKRHNDMAFNAVSLIKTYFGLDDLPARFSLKVEPYELSHTDRDYQTFLRVLNGKRPSL